MLWIACTIPVTSANNKREKNTALKLVKGYLHTTMTMERLLGLAMMNIHYKKPIDLDAVTSSAFGGKIPKNASCWSRVWRNTLPFHRTPHAKPWIRPRRLKVQVGQRFMSFSTILIHMMYSYYILQSQIWEITAQEYTYPLWAILAQKCLCFALHL